jgi:hypothetical protein
LQWHVKGGQCSAARPEAAIYVVPWEAGAYLGRGSFALLGFGDDVPGCGLYTDSAEGGSFRFAVGDPEITGYAENFSRVREMALDSRRSADLIRQVREGSRMIQPRAAPQPA